MTEIKTEIFNVKNIDCATCAAKIENGLKAVNGVNDAVLDFASLTLHVKAKDIARIVEEVRKFDLEYVRGCTTRFTKTWKPQYLV